MSGLPELQQLRTEEIDGRRYYVTPNGNKLPSITSVLGYFKRTALKEWRERVGHEEATKISTRASGRGTRFHSLLEKYLSNIPMNEILTENIMPDMKQSFNDMMRVLDDIDNIHYIESPLYSEKLRLAGRTDAIAEYKGILSVIDFKTAAREKKEEHIQDYFEQGTAYCMMYEERVGRPIEQIVVLISADGLPEPQVFVKNKKDYKENLLRKITTYHNEKLTK